MLKKSFWSRFLKIFSISFLFLGSIVAMVFGSINIGNNNNQRGLFGDTYTSYFDLDVSGQQSFQRQQEVVQQSADAFANWLVLRNISHISVESELVGDPSTLGTNFGRVYFELQNVPLVRNRDRDRQQNPIWVLLNTLNSSRITIQQYNPNLTNNNFGNNPDIFRYSPILNQESVNTNSARNDDRTERNTNGVLLDLNNTILDIQNFNDERVLTTPPTEFTQWFVFQNLDILIERLNYAKRLAFDVQNINDNNSTVSQEEAEQIIFRFETLPTEYQTWANEAIRGNNTDTVSEETILQFYVEARTPDSASSTNANSNLTAIVNQFLLTSQETNQSITFNNYNNWFPTATVISSNSTRSESVDGDSEIDQSQNQITSRVGTADVTRLSIQHASANARNDFIFQMRNTVIAAPMLFSDSASISDYEIFGNAFILNPFLNQSTTGLTAYQMTFISFSVLLLILAIVVSVLYRIPGLFGAFAAIATSVFSASFLVLLNVNFSISSFIVLFFGVIISVVAIALVMEKIKRTLNNRLSIFDSTKHAISKSTLSIVDIHIFPLLFGLMFTFLGGTELVDVGLTLILVSLVSLANLGLFFIMPLYIFSDVKFSWKTKFFVGIFKQRLDLNANFGFLKNTSFFLVSGLLLVSVLGLILAFVLGIQNSFTYSQGTMLFINTNETNANAIISALDSRWLNPTFSNGVLTASSTSIIPRSEVNAILAPFNNGITNFNVTITSPNSALRIGQSAIYAILGGMGVSAIYYMIRLNVFSVIPIFIITALTTLGSVAFIYLTQSFIDNFIISFLVFAVLITNLICVVYISSIKTEFVKNAIYSPEEIKNIIFTNFKSMFKIFSVVWIVIVIGSLFFLALISPLTYWLYAYIIIGTTLAMPSALILITYTYYWVMILRQKYVRNIFENFGEKISANKFNEVDEELVDSINKF